MFCAEDVTGLKPYTEVTELRFTQLVAERSVGLRRCPVRDAGGLRRENADMSSEKKSERLFR